MAKHRNGAVVRPLPSDDTISQGLERGLTRDAASEVQQWLRWAPPYRGDNRRDQQRRDRASEE